MSGAFGRPRVRMISLAVLNAVPRLPFLERQAFVVGDQDRGVTEGSQRQLDVVSGGRGNKGCVRIVPGWIREVSG
jgi:hypothetical protein